MTKLRLLLREYEDVRFATDTYYGKPHSMRFVFDTEQDRMNFVKRLEELLAEYMLYTDRRLYKVEVFLNDDNQGRRKNHQT